MRQLVHRGIGILALVLAALVAVTACAQTPARTNLPPAFWEAYKGAFLRDEGRIVDDANGGISHSEGQGYGMLLAVEFNDPGTFARLWDFTRTQLLIRDDGLAAWKWDPAANPHVVDVNNATDGDILIGWALSAAAARWNRPDYLTAAQKLVRAVADHMVIDVAGAAMLLPGAQGFTAADRPDGPVVNPSYWVFGAFPSFAILTPDRNWNAVTQAGLQLVNRSRFSGWKLPSDWVSLAAPDKPQPAEGFDPVFGYNSLRIPLYLLDAGIVDRQMLAPFDRAMNGAQAAPVQLVDVKTGEVVQQLTDPGYRVLGSLLGCALRGTAIPADLRRFEPTQYYPSTLHLFALSVAARRYPQCVSDG